MSIKQKDIKLLCQGQPPEDTTLLDEMTLGSDARSEEHTSELQSH